MGQAMHDKHSKKALVTEWKGLTHQQPDQFASCSWIVFAFRRQLTGSSKALRFHAMTVLVAILTSTLAVPFFQWLMIGCGLFSNDANFSMLVCKRNCCTSFATFKPPSNAVGLKTISVQ
jgi:hypothetical protein